MKKRPLSATSSSSVASSSHQKTKYYLFRSATATTTPSSFQQPLYKGIVCEYQCVFEADGHDYLLLYFSQSFRHHTVFAMFPFLDPSMEWSALYGGGKVSNLFDFIQDHASQLRILSERGTKPLLLRKMQFVRTYSCASCDYHTTSSSNYCKHQHTLRHQKQQQQQQVAIIPAAAAAAAAAAATSSAQSQQSLQPPQPPQPPRLTEAFVVEMMRNNQEFQLQMMKQYNDLVTKVSEVVASKPSYVHNDHRQQHNHFQLQVFLNDWCQGAMNMSEFVESIPYSPATLERAGETGFVQSMTELFVESLNKLDVSERPLHCTDVKRETIHIKENDRWEKDTATHTRLKRSLATIARMNLSQLPQWKQLNPDCQEMNTDAQQRLLRILRHALAVSGNLSATSSSSSSSSSASHHQHHHHHHSSSSSEPWDAVVKNLAKYTAINKKELLHLNASGGGRNSSSSSSSSSGDSGNDDDDDDDD